VDKIQEFGYVEKRHVLQTRAHAKCGEERSGEERRGEESREPRRQSFAKLSTGRLANEEFRITGNEPAAF
jgi:hypothetical protein